VIPDGHDSQILELYKLAVEMADRVSSRRSTANTFFVTVQTAFIAVVGVEVPHLQNSPWWATVVVAAAGLSLSACWWLQLRSYRDLNRAKFAVINAIEDEHLPLKVFSDEWKALRRDPIPAWRQRYAELGTIERFVPVVFASLYFVLLIGRLS
jgi:hypothetical protein